MVLTRRMKRVAQTSPGPTTEHNEAKRRRLRKLQPQYKPNEYDAAGKWNTASNEKQYGNDDLSAINAAITVGLDPRILSPPAAPSRTATPAGGSEHPHPLRSNPVSLADRARGIATNVSRSCDEVLGGWILELGELGKTELMEQGWKVCDDMKRLAGLLRQFADMEERRV